MEHYFTNNENTKSDLRTISYEFAGMPFNFISDLGVFSKDKIDYGSRLLVETFKKYYKNSGSILDVGCGYGFIGITLSKILGVSSTLVDVNKRAIHLTKMNIKNNNVDSICFLSNGYENINDSYKYIITNPPIRAGKETVLKILIGAKEYLLDDGELWFVIRKNHGAKSYYETLKKYYNIEIMEKSKGFYIFVAKKILT